MGSEGSLPQGWTPSELRALLELDEDPGPELDTEVPLAVEPTWRCLRCHSARWSEVGHNSYRCGACMGTEFYNATQPVRHQTDDGVWMFVPRANSAPVEDSLPEDDFRRRSEVRHPVEDSSPPGPDSAREPPESELPTDDPSVAMTEYEWPSGPGSELSTSSRRRRRRNRTTAQDSNSEQVGQPSPSRLPMPSTLPIPSRAGKGDGKSSEESELLKVLRQLLDDRRSDKASQGSWDSRRGPAPGMKWKGGTPPNPPRWNYAASDIRAFSKWERRVRVWQLQVQNQLSGAEAGLMLFASLTGEAEAESEHTVLSKVNCRDGVDYVINCLKGPLEQKILYQKRSLLATYETVARLPNESIRQYINRYKRIERDLQSVGISAGAMYDAESRGNRILERCKLEPSLARLVLIGAHNSLDFDSICESLQLQFPDFKATPALFQQSQQQHWRQQQSNSSYRPSGKWTPSNASATTASTSSSSTVPSSASAFNRGGKGGKSFHPRKVYQTETLEEGNEEDEPDQSPEADEEYFEPETFDEQAADPSPSAETEPADEDELGSSLNELATVLTVTSNKLRAATLGRKFTGRKSIEERKRTSSCSACGTMGHWTGDPGCPLSAGGKGRKGKGKGDHKGSSAAASSTSTSGPKRTFMVSYGDEAVEDDNAAYFNFPTNHVPDSMNAPFVYVTESIDLAGYMVLDTACQRSCTGSRWLNTHLRILENYGLSCHRVLCDEQFQFGAGACQTAHERCYLPAAFASQETQGILLGVSVVADVNIPFLASRVLMQQLGCVIDMHQNVLCFSNIGVTVPLLHKHGHLVASIVAFPPRAAQLNCWSELESRVFLEKPHPECIVHEALTAQDRCSSTFTAVHALAAHQAAAVMAGELEGVPPEAPHDRAQCAQGHAQACEHRVTPKSMVEQHRIGRPHGEATTRVAPASSTGQDLYSPRVQEVRERSRPVFPVQALRSKVPVDSRPRSLGSIFTKILQLVSTAAAILGHDPGPYGHRQAQEQTEQTNGLQVQGQTEATTIGRHVSPIGRQLSPSHPVPADGRGDFRYRPDQGGAGRGNVHGQPPPVRLRQSGRLSIGHGELGLEGMTTSESGQCDFWERGKGKIIRHHNIPRVLLFNLQDYDCPIPKHTLSPECKAEVHYEDGTFETITYDWRDHHHTQLKQPWTGHTTFMTQNVHNQSQSLLTASARRALRNTVRQTHHVYNLEYALVAHTADEQTLQQQQKHLRGSRPKVDILETFAGQANITKRSSSFRLSAAQPVDYATGWDLNNTSHQADLEDMLDSLRPLVLIQGIDCRDWSILQDNTNYIRRKILLLMRRAKARKLLKKVTSWCHKQAEAGRLFLLENPTTSRLWQEDAIKKLEGLPNVSSTTCHAGAYGAVNSQGQMIRKGHRFMGNCPHVLKRLGRHLSAEEQRRCVPLQGRETTLSQHYPHQMVTEILKGVQDEVRARLPDRFQPRPKVYSSYMVTSPDQWHEALQMAEATFQVTRYKTFTLPASDPLFALTRRLTQWSHMERVQIALQPIMWRFPWHVPHTHRAAALQYNDGEVQIIEEDLSELRHPKARFKKPVQLAIFMFGQGQPDAERPRDQASASHEAAQPPPSENDPRKLVPPPPGEEISFPLELKIPAEIKNAIRRMHQNLGHPKPAELKKLLALNGVNNQAIYTAVEHLRCNSCERTKGPSRPDLGAIPAEDGCSQFGDRLQMDIFYVRDVTGQNFMVLGIIDEVTHLHLAALLDNRQAETVLAAFNDTWAKAFGYPLRIRLDPDGSFRSHFEDDLDQAGVFIDYVPAEAHNKIGLIERHNAVFRSLMERIIDYRAITGREQMYYTTTAAAFAKNSCTWSAGRPPYVAAFGRIPRMGIELLSDPHGLVTGQTRAQAQQMADSLRVDAQQQIAAMSIDSTFRRALLRNTATSSTDTPEVGSIVAYWRWTARSGKKRGGYKLARLLGRDPDGKSMWLQAGTNTVRVAPHQLRVARGFECWHPDYQQIKDLRVASQNLHDNQLQDERIPEPPVDPDQPLGFDGMDPAEEIPPSAVPLLAQPPTAASAAAPAEQAEEAVQTDPYQETRNTQIEINVHSPTYRQTVIQAQAQPSTPFGMTAAQWMEPSVNAPVRKKHRSRTPARGRHASTLADASRPALQDQQDPLALTPATPFVPHQSRAEASATTPGQQAEVIDVDNLPDTPQPAEHLEHVVPSTPPDLAQDNRQSSKRSSTEMAPPLSEQAPPAPLGYKALLAKHTQPRQIGQNTFHLKGYNRIAKAATQAEPSLLVWARLDTNSNSLQTTHLSGPPKGHIKRRRVLTYPQGSIVWDAPYEDDQTGRRISPEYTTLVTELWHEHYAPHPLDSLEVTPDGIQQREQHHDGSDHISMPYSCHTALQAYRKAPGYNGTGESSDSEASADDMTTGHRGNSSLPTTAAARSLTRQEQKALDKEVPWQAILQMDQDSITKYVESAKAEEASWQQFDSVIPLTAQEANKVHQDPILRRRILKARAAYRDKAKGQGPLKAKTRVVALGHLDPDLQEICRESATPTRQSEYALLAFFISGFNHMLLDGKDRWLLWCGDIKTAFLQGTPDPRKLPLFLLPPQDGVTKLAGTFKAPLYKIVGNIYGLASAPRTWSLHVVKTLVQAGFRQHSLDKMLFTLCTKLPGDDHSSLVAIVVAYVDDFLLTHNQRWDRRALLDLFKWGAQEELSFSNSLTFKGKEISLRSEGQTTYLALTQKQFIAGMKVGNVQCKKRLDEKLLPEDMAEFRSVAGCLQWLAGQCRPDVASTVSLCSKGTNSTYKELQTLYEAVQHLHNTSDVGIHMWPVPLNDHTLIVSYSDSSWANAAGSASQHGNILLLADPKVVDTTGPGLLLDWKSSRSARVCRSTLAAEASACDTGIDRASFMAHLISEILQDKASFLLTRTLRLIGVTDCRSLYDVLVSENPRTEDKRTIVVIRSIQQHLQRLDVHWVPTQLQWADSLTKLSDKLLLEFVAWLRKPWIQLRDMPESTRSTQHKNTSVKFEHSIHEDMSA